MLRKFLQTASNARKLSACLIALACVAFAVTAVCGVRMVAYDDQARKMSEKSHSQDRTDGEWKNFVFAENCDSLVQEIGKKPNSQFVSLFGQAAGDECFAVIGKQIPQARIIVGMELGISDSAFASIAHANELRRLTIWKANVGDAGLVHLKNLTNLVELELEHTNITDAGLAQLSSLKSLRALWLAGNLNGSGLESLTGLRDLRFIGIVGPSFTDAGLTALPKMQNLESVNLCRSGISDEGLRQLGQCHGLKRLYLLSTAIGDEGIQHLASLKNLQYLDLRQTNVSRAGVRKLQAALPNCFIHTGMFSPANDLSGLLGIGLLAIGLFGILGCVSGLGSVIRR